MTETIASKRDVLPDLIRAWALIGIVLVNVELFTYDVFLGYSGGGLNSTADSVAAFLVLALFTTKSYSLFSLMFGAGLAYQFASAERSGAAFGPRYARRLFGLFVIGILHAVFFFVGDILVTYAVLGVVLYLCRHLDVSALWRSGIFLILLQVATLALLGCLLLAGYAVDPEDYARVIAEEAEQLAIQADAFDAARQAGFLAFAQERLQTLPSIYEGMIVLQGISAMGYFLIGLALMRQGTLSDPESRLWSVSRTLLMPLGLIGSTIGAAMYMSASGDRMDIMVLFGLAVLVAAAPLSSFGYIGWLAKLTPHLGPKVRTALAQIGGSSLTAYLLQSVILSLVFTGAGLGLARVFGAATNIGIALAAGLASLALVWLWRQVFERGPFEALLRRFTYLR